MALKTAAFRDAAGTPAHPARAPRTTESIDTCAALPPAPMQARGPPQHDPVKAHQDQQWRSKLKAACQTNARNQRLATSVAIRCESHTSLLPSHTQFGLFALTLPLVRTSSTPLPLA